MDDEETVRDVAGQILRHLGYETEPAKDGAEAVALYNDAMQSKRPFDLLRTARCTG